MTETHADIPKPKRHWYQYSLRGLFLATTLVAVFCSLFACQIQRAECQKRYIQAIENRGGRVYYDYQSDGEKVNWRVDSREPQFLRRWLGNDFFHRAMGVELVVLLPADWDEAREQSVFENGCLVPGTVVPSGLALYGPHGNRKPIWPTAAMRLGANEWARAALRHYSFSFGCDWDRIHLEYCRNALKLDPHDVEANLLSAELGAIYDAVDAKQLRAHLDTVVRYADPKSLEYAHAQKLLARKDWTFAELCQRIGPDGVLR